ncbi:MAG: hypothetical protein JW862_09025 [Anaerolineales bacterium]|nr:hypothetical protein [Anaerolineales bacterium]
MNHSPTVRSVLPAAVLLALAGWGGLAALFIYTLPMLGPRWLFFFFGLMAVSGTTLPLSAFLNRRFPTQPPASFNTLVREAILVGLWAATLAWLQLGRALTPILVIFLAAGLALIEWLLRLREKSRWQPG